MSTSARMKLVSWPELLAAREDARRAGRRVVFTNGCFDLLHVGHVRYLEEAAALGDLLLVGVNGDRSVAILKGEGRPIVPAVERAELVAALHCVDFVTLFEEPTPADLLERLRPDLHVKGGDYRPDRIPETAVVERHGGTVVVVSYVPDHSSTDLVRRIAALSVTVPQEEIGRNRS